MSAMPFTQLANAVRQQKMSQPRPMPQPITPNRYTRTRVRPIGPITQRPTNPAITNPNVRIGGGPAPIQQPPVAQPAPAPITQQPTNPAITNPNVQIGGGPAPIQQPAPAPFDPSGMQQLFWSGISPTVVGWSPPKAYRDSQGNFFDDKGNPLTYTPGGSENQDWNNKFGTLKDAQGNLYGGGGNFGGGKSYPSMPGGPFQSRPDLGPGVGFGPGLPQPQLEAMPYTDSTAPMQQSGMPGGKSNPIGNFIGSAASLIPNAIGNAAAQSQDPNAQRIAPLFTGLGGVMNQSFSNMGGKSGSAPNYQQTQATQQNPNVSIGMSGGFNPMAGNTTLPGNF